MVVDYDTQHLYYEDIAVNYDRRKSVVYKIDDDHFCV